MYRYRANGLQTCGLRTGVVVDIHAGCDQGSQSGSHAPLLPEEFLREMGRFKPDLVVDLGDRINNVNRAEDTFHLHRLLPFCLNGHLHWNHVLTGRSFTRVTVAALVETWESSGKPSGSFAEVLVTPGSIEIHVMGRLASHYRFEWEIPLA